MKHQVICKLYLECETKMIVGLGSFGIIKYVWSWYKAKANKNKNQETGRWVSKADTNLKTRTLS